MSGTSAQWVEHGDVGIVDPRVEPAMFGELAQHLRCPVAKGVDDLVRKVLSWTPCSSTSERSASAFIRTRFGERIGVLGPAGLGDDRLEVRRQGFEGAAVDDAFARAVGLVQAGAVIEGAARWKPSARSLKGPANSAASIAPLCSAGRVSPGGQRDLDDAEGLVEVRRRGRACGSGGPGGRRANAARS
jgi:hypothetical protein